MVLFIRIYFIKRRKENEKYKKRNRKWNTRLFIPWRKEEILS